MIIGEMGDSGQPLLFVGGNCAIQGFDYTGEDKFWTVSVISRSDCLSVVDIGHFSSTPPTPPPAPPPPAPPPR